MSLLADHNLPFAAALVLMAFIALAQVFGLGDLFGDSDLDADVDADGDLSGGIGDGVLGLMGVGRVPFLIWLAVFLFAFAAIGVSIQALAGNLTGAPLFLWLAALFAGVAALPLTGALVRPLGRILPQDETTAVTLDTLVGRRARIAIGRATRGSPARAQVRDRHGHSHNVMVEPHDDARDMVEGEEVLLVRREGETFYAVALAERLLASET